VKSLTRKARALLFAAAVAIVVLFRPASAHVRAAALLTQFSAKESAEHAVDESPADVVSGPAPFRARLYAPRGAPAAPGIVLAHGVHRLGIDEPRLVRFARAIATSGVVVLTPEIKELADYRVDPRSIDTIGAAAHALAARTGGPVGVMGMSFAGGLALLAAADARYAPDVGFVVAVGAHDDLGRVSRFFATSSIPLPNGTTQAMHAHDYGPLVLVYANVEDFFTAADAPAAREALRLWLWEERDAARARAAALSPEGRAKIDLLFGSHVDALAAELLAEIARREGSMGPVSPHGRLQSIHVPVFLLHGAGDTVIPASETLWLAEDVPRAYVHDVLVSPAIVHVELEGEPTIGDKWALVHFMAEVLQQASRR
jgi:dienelactone hydrolase